MARHLWVLLLLLSAVPAGAQSIRIPSGLEFRLQQLPRDPALQPGEQPRSLDELHGVRLRDNPTPGSLYLSLLNEGTYGWHPFTLSRLDLALEGADIGMSLGLLAGAAATTFAGWDDGDAWYLAGALAAVGALWGGTKGANNSALRIRYRWEPEGHPAGGTR